uniref:Uncharacterized protein n=1 Tax=Setaria italica TaxID=4555 RepID=K4ANE8_SETIT
MAALGGRCSAPWRRRRPARAHGDPRWTGYGSSQRRWVVVSVQILRRKP